MNFGAENFYAGWRARGRSNEGLREENSLPPEKLLQRIWQHQRLQRDQLRCLGGKSLRVLHPGFASAEGGPDFRGAVLQLENEKPVSGDVEIDLQTSGWHAHRHDKNPNFKNVILHVIWDGPKNATANAQSPPTVLALKNFLDAPIAELVLALENESGLPENLRGKCSAPLQTLDKTQLADLLQAAAAVRLQNKAGAILVRARQAGWEQALWENLFRALGYKHNVWPMLTLAESKNQWARNANSAFEIQARLLGMSGLLPPELPRAQKGPDTFLRRAWDCWWRERDEFSACTLPRITWKFHGLRPANHPQRRLALAAHWLASGNFINRIENWIARDIPEKNLLPSLHEIFQIERDEFWSWHWTFNSARLTKPQPLLGAARVTDLAVNVVLPWLWIRAREGGSENILLRVEQRFLAWPAAEDNSVLKLARRRLLGTADPNLLKSAAAQQGLMQIVRDFCEHSNAICADCRFPELVQSVKSKIQP